MNTEATPAPALLALAEAKGHGPAPEGYEDFLIVAGSNIGEIRWEVYWRGTLVSFAPTMSAARAEVEAIKALIGCMVF